MRRLQVVAGAMVVGAWIVGLILATGGRRPTDSVAGRGFVGQPSGHVNDRDVAHRRRRWGANHHEGCGRQLEGMMRRHDPVGAARPIATVVRG
jgi:hypothetical protein